MTQLTFSQKTAQELNKYYKYRIELHSHTSPVSPCSQVKPTDVVRIFRDAGYDGIAVTNHFFPGLLSMNADEYVEAYKKDFFEAVEEGERIGIKVYQGAELRFLNENNNDYLLFGYDFRQLKEIHDYLNGDLATFVSDFKTEDMLLVQAHPFRNGMFRADPKLLDAIEAFNVHPSHNSRIAQAAKYAAENKKIMTVGTDYHHIGHDGLSATRTHELPENTQELVKVLKSGDFIIEIAGKLML